VSPPSGDIKATEKTSRFANVVNVANVAKVKTEKSPAFLSRRDLRDFWPSSTTPQRDFSDSHVVTLATAATIENRAYETNDINVATQWRQSGDTSIERTIRLDFETRNTGGINLKTAGAWVYAQHPQTEILTLSYRTPSQLRLWRPGPGYLPVPLAWFVLAGFRFSSLAILTR
jgi:hypothetical protein